MNAPSAAAPGPDPAYGRPFWRRALRFEVSMYVGLLRWWGRRPAVPAGATPLRYAGVIAPTLWLWTAVSAVEMVVVHLVLPWETVRTVLLVVSIWGLVWMLGLLGTQIAYPHLLERGLAAPVLRLRSGRTLDLPIPLDRIRTVESRMQSLPATVRRGRDSARPDQLFLGLSGMVNVHLGLDGPIDLDTPAGRHRVEGISFWVDDPAAAVALLRAAKGAASR
jgi:hypothetical protein